MTARLTLVADNSAAPDQPVTKAQQKMLDAAAAICAEPENVEWAFMARQLVQCTLPHRTPKEDLPVWKRRNGNLTLAVIPGINPETGETYGYPYGIIPRLLLFWIVTEAKRTADRRLELGHSLAHFIDEIGLNADTGGGKRGDAKRLRDQMQRLFRARISFQQSVSDGSRQGTAWRDMQVAPEGELWWDTHDTHQGVSWGSWIELGDKFFEAIMSSPIPYDMRVLRALKRSPLALDVYSVLNYRAYTTKEPLNLSWEMLMGQLGAGVASANNFRIKVLPVLQKISALQGQLKIKRIKGGLTVYPSRPSITPKQPSLHLT